MNFLKRITTVLFFTSMAILPSAQSALNDFDRQEFPFKNGLAEKNPGLESGSAGWTCSPSMTVNSGTQINPRSRQFGQWDSNGAGQNCYSTAVKIPQSGNCSVGIWYAIPSGTGTHLLVANDGTNDLATESITSSTLAQYQEVEFPCSSSTTGNARIGIRSVAANEPSISYDDGYVGRSTLVRDVNIQTVTTPYSPTFNSTSGHSASNGWWYRRGDRLVMGGSIQWNGGGAATTFTATLPSGLVADTTKLNESTASGIRNGVGFWGWYDDAGGGAVDNQWVAMNDTVSIKFFRNSNTVISNIFANADRIFWQAEIPIVGWNERSALDADETVDFTGAVFYVGTSTCPAGSLDADGVAVSRTQYSRLFAKIGTTFGVGDGSTTFNKPDLRGIFVRGVGSQTISSITYTGVLGTRAADQMQGHFHQIIGETTDGGSGGGIPRFGGGTGRDVGVGAPRTDGTNGTPRTGTQTHPANIGMRPCIAWGRAPSAVLTNSVSTSNVNGDKIGSARLDCDAASTIVNNPQGMASTLSNISGGSCTLGLATGYFSAAPICTVSWDGNSTRETFYSVCTTSTSCAVGGPGTATTAQMNIICFGPR